MRKRPTTEEQTQPIPRETLAELAAAWREEIRARSDQCKTETTSEPMQVGDQTP